MLSSSEDGAAQLGGLELLSAPLLVSDEVHIQLRVVSVLLEIEFRFLLVR